MVVVSRNEIGRPKRAVLEEAMKIVSVINYKGGVGKTSANGEFRSGTRMATQEGVAN